MGATAGRVSSVEDFEDDIALFDDLLQVFGISFAGFVDEFDVLFSVCCGCLLFELLFSIGGSHFGRIFSHRFRGPVFVPVLLLELG